MNRLTDLFLAQLLDPAAESNFYTYINDLFLHKIVPLALIGSIFMFGVGGLFIIFSGGDATKIATGKEIITGTIVGLILILLAQLILASIDSNLAHVFQSAVNP